MIVHHLTCAAIPFPGMPAELPPIPCHVLLLETGTGLVLVDAGFAVADHLESGFPGPVELAARHQVERLGFAVEDVTDIVVTHMDGDHIGGLVDFPHARVHVTADEHAAAVHGDYDPADSRYRPRDWAHGPLFELHAGAGDTEVLGLTGHAVLPGVTLVPMAGHTPGHAIVVVETGDGVVVHAGDASFDGSVHGAIAEIAFLRDLERGTSFFPERLTGNHRELARLAAIPGVSVVNTHDARLLAS